MSLRVVRRRSAGRPVGRSLRNLRIAAAQEPEKLQRIHAEEPPADKRDRDRSEADSVYGSKSSARAARVLDVFTLFLSVHFHGFDSRIYSANEHYHPLRA